MPSRSPAPAAMQWEIDVPILTHPLMLVGFFKIFAIAGLLMWGLVSFIFLMQREYWLIGQMGLMTAAIVAGLMVVGALATLLFYRNRFHMRFTLDDKAALSEMRDTRARRVNRLAIVLGTLAGKPGAVGAGLIGEATASTHVAWPSVVSLRVYPRWNVIALGNSWRTIMLLFCEPKDYEAIRKFAEAAHAAHPAKARSNPVPGLLLRTALTLVACIPLFNLPVKIDSFAPFFTLCFALASVWLIPHLSWAVLLGLGATAWSLFVGAVEPFQSMFTRQAMSRYEIFSGDDMAVLVLAAVGALYLVGQSAALLRGTISSGLAGDLMEMDDA
jgi:hypothetical protein